MPGRPIERKNLGEMVMRALLERQRGRTVAVTLPPASIEAEENVEFWQKTAAETGSPVTFPNTPASSLEIHYDRCEAVLNTSVREGFGQIFVEPWPRGRACVGRGLPEITRELENSGLDLAHLISAFRIPFELVDPEEWRASLLNSFTPLAQATGEDPASWTTAIIEQSRQAAFADFGWVNRDRQRQICLAVASSPTVKADLDALNPLVIPPAGVIEKNAAFVQRTLHPQKVAARWEQIYQQLVEQRSTGRAALDPSAVARAFALSRVGFD